MILFFSVFSVVLVSIEKIHQTLDRVFHHISKHLEVRQKYSTARRIFNSLLGVWKCDEKRFLVFDILLLIFFIYTMFGSMKYPALPREGIGNSREEGVSKTQNLKVMCKKCMKLNWNFQKGWGHRANPFHGG